MKEFRNMIGNDEWKEQNRRKKIEEKLGSNKKREQKMLDYFQC